jgi:hypothetical protein
LGVIKPNEIGKELKIEMPDTLDYIFFESNRTEILNLINNEEFVNYE